MLNKAQYTSEVAKKILYDLVEKLFLINKDKLIIVRNSYGKPYFLNYPKLHFNISHSGNKIVCALSNIPIGVDIEKIGNPNLKLAKRFFLLEESNYILDAKFNIVRKLRFYKVWTRKEAYVKKIGKGLTILLSSFSVLGGLLKYNFKTTIRIKSVISICYTGNAKIHYKHIKKYQLQRMLEKNRIN